jgi:glucoamylase
MQHKPFLIDAVLGNSRMLATLTGDGEIQRIFWPHVDGGQHVARLLGGVSVAGADVQWQDDPAWRYEQAYEPDQNLLRTTAYHPGGLQVLLEDATVPGRDLFVRRVTFTNRSSAPMDLQYVLYQWLQVDENPLGNTAMADSPSESLVHFRRDVFVAVGGDRPLAAVDVGRPEAVLAGTTQRRFGGGRTLHGDVAAAGAWDLGSLAAGESAVLSLFWALGTSIRQVQELLAGARRSGSQLLLDEVRTYWTEWLDQARPLVTGHLAEQRGMPGEIEVLYRRSLLVFKLLSDEVTGAVIAAPEFDPGFTACGGYGYCWGRDAAYVTVAMDLAGYHDLAGAFYRWALKAQEPEGWWMHRHDSAGRWGSSWGLIQVDETGSILYGMAIHARLHGGAAFARLVWPSVRRAADWLIGNLDPVNGLPAPSVDLWEERAGQHTYSAAAVFGGLRGAAELGELIGEKAAAGRYREAAAQLQVSILTQCVSDGLLLRGRNLELPPPALRADEDPVADASLLGLSVPFGVVEADAPLMTRTAERLVAELWTPRTGGLRRYSDDPYRGGNPWVLCTLWLGLYAAEGGDAERARQLLDWAVERRTETGLLAEQLDPQTGRPVWVVPLTWSHAMYVLLALKLYGSPGQV